MKGSISNPGALKTRGLAPDLTEPLERHEVVDVLSDRSADATGRWLEQHPGIEIVSRDRCGLYAEGARQGAPQAQQVADRFHLLQNLRQT